MNTHRLFWGLLIILLGGMLLLNTLGILTINAWQVFWPLVLILIGGWMLLAPIFFKRNSESQQVSIPLGSASALKIKVKHGAGRLHIGALPTGSQAAVSGNFGGGVDYDNVQHGSEMKIKLKAPSDAFWGISPISEFEGLNWDVSINRDVSLQLLLHSGANEANLDLTDLKISYMEIETGASSTQIILPANAGYSQIKINSGASAVKIQVPESVAGRFNIKHGMAGINVDTSRFPSNGDGYETPGYITSVNKVEVFIETGVGSVEIH